MKINLIKGIIIFIGSLVFFSIVWFVFSIIAVAGEFSSNLIIVFDILESLSLSIGLITLAFSIFCKFKKRVINEKVYVISIIGLFFLIFYIFYTYSDPIKFGFWSHYEGGGSYLGSDPVLSPDGNFVVFSSPITGHGDVYLIDLNTKEKKRLTVSDLYEGFPSFSPNSSKIVYLTEKYGKDSIFIMDKDGSNKIQLTNYDSDSRPRFSNDGKRVLFEKKPEDSRWKKFYEIGIDGTGLKLIKENSSSQWEPFYSNNDENLYYFVSREDESNKSEYYSELRRLNISSQRDEYVERFSSDKVEENPSIDGLLLAYINQDLQSKIYDLSIINIVENKSEKINQEEKNVNYVFPISKDSVLYLIDKNGRGLGDIVIADKFGKKEIIGQNY